MGTDATLTNLTTQKQALIESARTGNLAALKFLFHIRCFNARYNWVEVCNTCVVYNQVECLRFLTTLNLKYARCNLGQDPIYEAILRDRLECLKILVAAGFEIEDGEFGHLWMAEAMKSKNCAKYLVSLGYKSVDWIAVHRSFELEVREKETCCKICVLANVITYECMSCNKSACGECILKYFEELTCMHCGEQYSYLNVRYLPIYAVEYKKIRVKQLLNKMQLPSKEDIRENNEKINDIIRLHGNGGFQQRLKLFKLVDSCKRVSCTGRRVDGVCVTFVTLQTATIVASIFYQIMSVIQILLKRILY